jgi:hypothetical protein
MHSASLRRLCEFQLLALVFALPFEYYFFGTRLTLYTTLKLQALLLLATWAGLKFMEFAAIGAPSCNRILRALPGRLQYAIAAFVLVQLLAAAFAPEYRGNALKAACKTGVGALIFFLAADVSANSRPGPSRRGTFIHEPLFVLSASGTCLAILGLGQLAGSGILTRLVRLFQSTEYFLGNRLRFTSTAEYPNTAGSLLSVALCATLALTAFGSGRSGSRIWNRVWPAVVAIQVLALTLTYSRGALVATIVAVFAATCSMRRVVRPGRPRSAVVTVLTLSIVGTAVAFLVRHAADRDGTFVPKRVARYGLGAAGETRRLLPDRTYEETLAVENDSALPWRRNKFGIAYRWYRLSDGNTCTTPDGIPLVQDVVPGQQIRMTVPLNSPRAAGEYLLIWFLYGRDDGNGNRELRDSYSPAILCTVRGPDEGPMSGMSERARHYLEAIRKERRNLEFAGPPRRPELWVAAIRMLLSRPLLGIGPDNFRLRKWEFMDAPGGDTTILANSLYLEILSGSGVLGFGTFLWLLWEFYRPIAFKAKTTSPSAAIGAYFGVAYLAGFLSHGFVDYFLKFTPVFLLFWVLLGMLCTDAQRNEEATCA